MRTRAISVIVFASVSLGSGPVFSQTSQVTGLTTNFFRGPALTPNEIETVLQLAQQCGLERPERISDTRVLPELKSVPRSLTLNSSERVEGRKTFRYWVRVGNTNWSPAAPAPDARRLGAFYVNTPYLHKTELTLFNVGTNTLKLSLGQDIPLDVADAIVGRFARREVRFSSAQVRSDWERENLDVSQAAGLSWFRKENFYRMYFGSPTELVIQFRYVDDEVMITDVGSRIAY